MDIRPLADCPEQVPLIAEWFYREWSHFYDANGQTQADVEARIRSWATRRGVPMALVAFEGDEMLGVVALKRDEPVSPRYTPWLGGLFVLPEWRGQGLGSALVAAAEKQAAAIGYHLLYLFTDQQEDFYLGLGWETIERPRHAGQAVALMCKSLD